MVTLLIETYFIAYNIQKKEGKEGHVLFNDALNTFYLRLYGREEGNFLFNDALNTFLFTVIWKEGRKFLI